MRNKLRKISMLALTHVLTVPGFAEQVTEVQNTLPVSQSSAEVTPGPSQQSVNSPSTEGGLQEILVTAQRRSESLQNVPIAVTALERKDIQDKGLTSPFERAVAVPNLTIMKSGPSILNPFIRGVGEIGGGPNDEPSVATYVGGVYIASP